MHIHYCFILLMQKHHGGAAPYPCPRMPSSWFRQALGAAMQIVSMYPPPPPPPGLWGSYHHAHHHTGYYSSPQEDYYTGLEYWAAVAESQIRLWRWRYCL